MVNDNPNVAANGVSSMEDATGDSAAETTARENYHHGDLPQTLMALALSHIKDHGTEKLSLRALAREAGVSPTAPYKHFPSKQCLLAALATQGFVNLGKATRTAIESTNSLEDRVVAMGMAYIQFAQDNPTAYHLMFGSVLADFSKYEMLHNAATSAYDEVNNVLRAIVQEKGLEVDIAMLGGVTWSFVHGMASLLIDHVNLGGPDASPMMSIAALDQDPETAMRTTLTKLLMN